MEGWATMAWISGLVASLAVNWMWRQRRRVDADAAPGFRVGRHRYHYPSPWLLLVAGVGLVVNGLSIAISNPLDRGRLIGPIGIVLGAGVLGVGVGGLLRRRRWYRRRSGGTDQRSSS